MLIGCFINLQSMFSFQHIDYLIVLAAVPLLLVLYLIVWYWKKRTIKKIGDANLVKEMTKNYSPQKFALKFVLSLAAFILCGFALANLRSPRGMEKVNRNGIDIIIALDVSKSMLAQDIKPNRLERAKQALSKLIDKLGNDRVGIVVFAGRAYLQMPLTGDHGAAKMYLASASTDIVPTQGTVIADALKMCNTAFNSKEKKYKAVILISDGEDHDEGALTMAGQMADEGIMINTVGIGSPQGSTILDELTNQEKKDINGNTVITRLNEDELKKIAEKGNGTYQLFGNTDELVNNLDTQLGNMDQRTVTEDSLVNYENFFPYFLALGLVLLVIELFLSERKRLAVMKLSTVKKTVLVSLVFIAILPITSFAQDEKELIKKGNDAYEKKEYDKAIVNYQQATEKAPANPTAQYNLGNALYKNKKVDEAVQAYDDALSNATSNAAKAKAFYNKGVVLQNNKKLVECIEAYKNALKLDPQDEDARQNLQRALQEQKEQQKKENKNKKEEKKPKDDKKQKEKDKPKEEEKQQPKPQPSKLTKQDAEEKLKALLQQEKNLQDKLRKVNTATSATPEKDW
jgi:tetratricopeptide (TPR) repeat protein